MNSTVGPIFNKKVIKKWYLWVLCTVYGKYKTDKSDQKKKKHKYEIHCYPNIHYINLLIIQKT